MRYLRETAAIGIDRKHVGVPVARNLKEEHLIAFR
jgi:hypothetical protein